MAASLCWWCFLQDAVFPLYDKVEAQHVVPGMRALLKQLHAEIDALEASGGASRAGVACCWWIWWIPRGTTPSQTLGTWHKGPMLSFIAQAA